MRFKDFQQNKEAIAIRLIKLVSGESIICRAPDKRGTTLTIYCPMQVIEIATDLEDDESAYVMAPWIPFAADQTLKLNKTAIILITDVHEDMAQESLERVDVFVNGDPVEELPLKMRRQCDHRWSTETVEEGTDSSGEEQDAEDEE